MELVTYSAEMLPGFTDAYNAGIRHVPHCFPVTQDALGAVIAADAGEAKSDEAVRSGKAFVAIENGTVTGFIDVAVGRPKPDREEQGVIRFLWYAPGSRCPGQSLLDAGETHALGFRHAAISTALHNHRAFLFYSNFGYHVADWTYDSRRDLHATQS